MFKRFFVKNSDDERYIFLYENNKLHAFLYKYQRLILLICLLLLLLLLSLFGYNIYSINSSSDTNIKYSENNLSFDGMDDLVTISGGGSDNLANNILNSEYDSCFKKSGEVLVKKVVSKKKYKIIFFTDGSALRISGDEYLRIAPLENGAYGISEKNVLDINASTRTLNVFKTVSYFGGNIIYFDDGSAYSDSELGCIFIRNSDDIFSNYISSDKLSYKINNKTYGNNNVTEFSDGTVLVVIGDKKYLIHNSDDILINNNDISYPNGNNAFVINSVQYLNNTSIDYFSDGSAIIYTSDSIFSIRRSNSIVISNNNFIELVSSNEVDICNTISRNGTNIYYYTNGSAIIDLGGSNLYIPDNSLIKFHGNTIDYGNDYEVMTSDDYINNQLIKKFNNTVYVEMNENKYIIDSNSISYYDDGSIKSFDNTIEMDTKGLNITNNSHSLMYYRVVLEEGSNTSLDSKYIKYMISVNGNNSSKYLNNNIWNIGSKLDDNKSITNTSYILYDGEIKPLSTVNVRVVFWVDYENITNDMMNTSFVGTMKVYSSLEES